MGDNRVIVTPDGARLVSTILDPDDVRGLAARLAGLGERVVPVRDERPELRAASMRDRRPARTYDLDVS